MSKDTLSINAELTIQQLIKSKTKSASQYLENESNELDTLILRTHLSELEKLYTMRGLSNYENETLSTLIKEYKRRIKEHKEKN